MSPRKIADKWETELRGLPDEQVRERERSAEENERSSLVPGTGRNPKAARMWRSRATAASAELDRRGIR